MLSVLRNPMHLPHLPATPNLNQSQQSLTTAVQTTAIQKKRAAATAPLFGSQAQRYLNSVRR